MGGKKLVYKLRSVPDLTLNKYSSLSDSGVEGALAQHNSFLRQWELTSSSLQIDIEYCCCFDPKQEEGNQLQFYLGFSLPDDGISNVIESLVLASPLKAFYDFRKVDPEEEGPLAIRYPSISYLKKKERERTSDSANKTRLFTARGWKSNEDARLYDMFRAMKALCVRSAYSVTLRGVDAYDKVAAALEKPITILRKRVHGNEDEIKLTERGFRKSRDVASEDTLHTYEEFLNDISESPCFRASVRAYADTPLVASTILHTACGEAIKEGDCALGSIEGANLRLTDNPFPTFDCAQIMPESLRFWPTLFTLEEIAPFFRYPALNDGERIALNKETSPSLDEEGLLLGSCASGEVKLSPKALMKHAFVCGVPGSGKTNTMLGLSMGLRTNEEAPFDETVKRPIPFLVLEPAKREYRELSLFDIPELVVFSPAANTRFPLELNPFEFPLGLTLSEHITKLREVFEGAFPIEPPAPFILEQSIEAVYEALGWRTSDINTGELEYPTMSELYAEFERQIAKTSYDSEIQGNIRSVLEMRIGSLLRREKKDMFDVRRSILKPEEWLERPIIVELEALGRDGANFVTLLLCTLIREVLKVSPMDGVETRELPDGKSVTWKPLRHVIFIEEAHNLIASQQEMDSAQSSNPKIAATECIVSMLKEVRALREGVIIADQLPSALALDVIKNTNVKIAHRLTFGDERALIASAISASELQAEEIATFLPGQALVSYEGMLRPFSMRIRNIEKHGSETPNDQELFDIMKGKPGQTEMYTRYEGRSWFVLQQGIADALAMEKAYCESLEGYPFEGRSQMQIEDFFDQCTKKYQALEILRNTYLRKSGRLAAEYVGVEMKEKTETAAQVIGQTYRLKLMKAIEQYMEE